MTRFIAPLIAPLPHCLITSLLILALAASAAAQTPSAAGDIQGAVHLGNRVLNRGVSNTYKKGWDASASYRITDLISAVGEVSGDYRKLTSYTANRYTFAGGARFQAPSGAQVVNPYLQILLGAGSDNGDGTGKSNRYPVLLPGGGVDLRLARCLAVRAKLDFPLYMTFGDVFKGMRAAVGLSVAFGTRK